MITLGIDVGSSSVKVSLLDVAKGTCLASAFSPEEEMAISAPQNGWAEQKPEDWWHHFKVAFQNSIRKAGIKTTDIKAIGISYQMHGLVALDEKGNVVRPSIIWCDSRAVKIGNDAFKALGNDFCLSHMLNSPGNFTASKLRWIKENEPELFARISKIMLPGDYIAFKLSGKAQTTVSGLSEGILWDFKNESLATGLMEHYGISKDQISDIVPTFGFQSEVNGEAAAETGLAAGVPITYRAGDQPNNAFSLNVMQPGEVAATGGTSGVIYGVNDSLDSDAQSRVNCFAHVNHQKDKKRIGVLLCINGTGILNSWIRRNMTTLSYAQMNDLAATVPAGADGLLIYPFGNGAERILVNASPGAMIKGLSFNNHTQAHILRAAQEGIVYSFKYGAEIMEAMGISTKVVRAGKANMFLSPLFRQTMANVLDARIELYDTDGALGAARGAALGAGLYKDAQEAFGTFECLDVITPDSNQDKISATYAEWKNQLSF
jgi:xylulokinase